MVARFLLRLAFLPVAIACTNFMISPAASEDGSALTAYTCDGPKFATLIHLKAQAHAELRRALNRTGCSDLGPKHGEVAMRTATFNVVGLVNEHAVAIGETTFGGLPELRGSGLLTYCDLMELVLQTSRSARDAIRAMDALIREYGYGGPPGVETEGCWGTGESFTIADTEEVWHMELIGKGMYDKGAVWVAMRVPEGFVGGHANQARITRFPLDAPDDCMYSDDVISFAVDHGLYPRHAPEQSFSFADAYDPITFFGARSCDARVWSFFSQVAGPGFEKRYDNYVTGKNLTNRMPLFVKPVRKLSLTDLFGFMRNHYENTALDDRHDVGAGPFHGVFRNEPSTWRSGGHAYVNERHVGVPYASTRNVAQLRGWLPKEIGGINWFSVDDASFSVHAPFRGSSTRVPVAYAHGNGAKDKMNFESAFWVFNMVANFAYYRYSQVAPLITSKVQEYEDRFIEAVAAEDKIALELWSSNRSTAVEFLTASAEKRGNALVKDWLAFYQSLFVDFRDGAVPAGMQAGYAQDWYDRVAKETGERYKIPDGHDMARNEQKLCALRKMSDSACRNLVSSEPQTVI